MSQMVSIHVGTFGTRVGAEYWKLLEAEYAVFAKDGIDKSTDYNEGLFGGFHPRAVMINSGQGAYHDLDLITPLGNFCNNSCFITDDTVDVGSMIEPIMDAIRYQAEQCDFHQGF